MKTTISITKPSGVQTMREPEVRAVNHISERITKATISITKPSGVQTMREPEIRIVDHIPLGRELVTQKGYVLYSTENEQYLSYYSESPQLCWREKPINLFMSEDIDNNLVSVVLAHDIQSFVGKEAYSSCFMVPSVYYSRPVDAPTINDKASIIEVHLVQDFRRAFPWSDIAPWQS